MKKLFAIFISLFLVEVGYAQDRVIMNNPYGYGISSYVYYGDTLKDLSYQDVLPSYAALSINTYGRKINFDNVGFLRNGTGLRVSEGSVYIQNSDFTNNTNSGLHVNNYSHNYIAGLNNVQFMGNRATSGGGIYSSQTDYYLKGDSFGSFDNVQFYQNVATYKGGGIYLAHSLQNMQNVTFNGNTANMGGAIYADNDLKLTGGSILFLNNSASYGGGIYANKNLSIQATSGDIIFTNNSGNAIYMADSTYKLSLQPTDTGNIVLNDSIGGTDLIHIEGSGRGKVFFNKVLGNKLIKLNSGMLKLNSALNWSSLNVEANGGSLDLLDGESHLLSLNTLTLNNNLTLNIEADLQNGVMDRLNVANVLGVGKIEVTNFNLLTSYTSSPVTIPFMINAGKEQVSIPTEANDDIYNYKTTYNANAGTVTFTPSYLVNSKGLSSVKSFAPQATLFPMVAYATADSVLKSIEIRTDFRKGRISEYDNPEAFFYITPYYQSNKLQFTNDAEVKSNLEGLHIGYATNDLELFDDLQVSTGIYFNAQKESFKYNGVNSSQMQYQTGGDLSFNLYSFFAGVVAQVGLVNRKDITSGNLFTGGADGRFGFNFDIASSELFLQPYASYSYSYVSAPKDSKIGNTTAKIPNYSLAKMQGGLRLLKYYGDVLNVYVEGKYIKQNSFKPDFYVSNVRLPDFELDAYYEAELGFTKIGEKIDWLGKVAVSFGSQKAIAGNLSLQF